MASDDNTPAPRPGTGLNALGLPDIHWCRVPAGTFRMGGDSAAAYSWDDAAIRLAEDYWIARNPITIAQFIPFLNGGSYATKSLWSKVGSYPLGRNDVLDIRDLSGNCSEWCCSLWSEPYQFPELTSPEGAKERAARSGSSGLNDNYARAASRDYLHPAARTPAVGFRLVVAPPL